MFLLDGLKHLLRIPHARAGAALLILGEALILVRVRPFSDFYFPFTWLAFILLVDAGLKAHSGRSLFSNHRPFFLLLFPLSAGFWWIFELLNGAVGNWAYIGAERYTGFDYALIASIDFSTVLPAVWEAALLFQALSTTREPDTGTRTLPRGIALLMLIGGGLCIGLPIVFPHYAFGLIWGSLFLLLDPINAWMGRPSLTVLVFQRRYVAPFSFAFGALLCGVFWEGWNFWAIPKWTYHVPYVNFAHVFEMPLLGFGGYLPFGLELFAMTNFALAILRRPAVTLRDINSANSGRSGGVASERAG